ncbi:RNA 2',3'-cyclic phosphodiesterase [Crenobacter cavernae]|uniref:RNA 2',3'-cyclic phosphodiesterase n=1 Tax=Crenobacter cavernae TaxID=2290923 RepID=A0A345Y4Q8_9NEIS|nr:RNA 2',3'-cyclic phosphodiesterase [Crenobacter cavernae]AXK38910.1 RNA 2',3'-cyclic phosphodiesterase [Crenobacter cavernae]
MRLFFAVWPDNAARAALAQHAIGPWPHGTRPIRDDALHLTLAFLGDVDEAVLPALEALGARLGQRCVPTRMRLTKFGHWNNGIVWAAPERTPKALTGLVAELRQGLAELGVESDTRRYKPHITLARRASHLPPLAPGAIVYPLDHLALVASEAGPTGQVAYRTLARWPLSGRKKRARSKPEAPPLG